MRTQSLDQFCAWIEQTPLSQTIQVTGWFVPTVQTIHILAVAAVMASIMMLDLRLLGIVGKDLSLARVSKRYRPIIWWALPVLLLTGILMITGEPVRSLENPVFQLKMLLLIAVIIITLAYQAPLNKDTGFWEASSSRRGAIKLIAILSLLLWIAIVCAGRWIAYI